MQMSVVTGWSLLRRYLQSERKPQLLEHRCLQGEYEDHFWQFSAHQSGILSNKAYNKDIINTKRTDQLKINEYP